MRQVCDELVEEWLSIFARIWRVKGDRGSGSPGKRVRQLVTRGPAERRLTQRKELSP